MSEFTQFLMELNELGVGLLLAALVGVFGISQPVVRPAVCSL
jgi:hypothetical protein